MNTTMSLCLLLSVPCLPLLLALPALRSRLSRPCLLALLPAVILLLVPAVFSIELPWLLFGTGLGIDGVSRLMLAMSVLLWAAAAMLLQASTSQTVDNSLTTFFLLTMASNLGVILITELVGFLAFSTLMGYGFYGLLVAGGDEHARRAGRVYLGFMIVADLLLFEAVLIAAATTGNLDFEAVRHTMARSPALDSYLLLVISGFALKAGAWPLHFWLALAFRTARPVVALLLGGVPVAIALLGMVRWLPLGEMVRPGLGQGIQWLALATAIYGTVVGLLQSHPRALLAYAGIVVMSLFLMTLGAGLEWPMIGSVVMQTAHLSILYLGLSLAALVPGSELSVKIKSQYTLHFLLLAGRGAGSLLLVLSPMVILFLTRIPDASASLFADSGIGGLWPWWSLCTTLLAVRWLYLLKHSHRREISIPGLWAVWGVLLVLAYTSGLFASVRNDDPMAVIVDVWWLIVPGILIGGSVWWMAVKKKLPFIPLITPGDLWSLLERWFFRGNRWAVSIGLQVLPRWRASGIAVVLRLLKVRAWQKALDASERSLQSWTLAVTLLLLLGISIALLST